MRVFGPLLRGLRSCFRTRRRGLFAVLVLAAAGWLAWYGVRVGRARLAVRDAERALARYDFPTARERLRLATDLRPRRPEGWLLAAQAARRDGDANDAKGRLARYEALTGRDTPEGRLEASLQLVQQGAIERDVDHLITLADAGDPATEQILEALAVGATHIYHIDREGFWLHHLLTRFPKNPIGRLIRAQMDDTLGRRERAAAGCRELLADFPDNWKARLLLAGLLYRAQQHAEAAAEYEEVRRQRPDDMLPLLGLARCRERMGRAEEARGLLQELERKFPDRGDALLECGRFALKEDRLADAEPLLRRAVELAPNDHEAHYHLGLCLERRGRGDEARHHLARFNEIETDLRRMDALLQAVVKSPRDPAPRREAGQICLRNGDIGEGLRWFQGALEVAPDDKATHAALANYYLGRGDAARASFHSQRAR